MRHLYTATSGASTSTFVYPHSRRHANFASPPPDPPSPSTSKARPSPATSTEESRSLSESASRATQQHSSPEGAHHTPPTKEEAAEPAVAGDVSKVIKTSEKEQTRRDWEIIKQLLPNIWPKNDWGTKIRVLVALGLLIGGKVRRTLFSELFFRTQDRQD